MNLFIQDLQMWAETTCSEVYVNAYAKAKRILERGFDVTIDQVDHKTINVTEGRYNGNKITIKEKRVYTPRKKKEKKWKKT